MKKRYLIFVCVTLAFLCLIVGCSSPIQEVTDPQADSTATSPSDIPPNTLKNGNSSEAAQEAAQAFIEENVSANDGRFGDWTADTQIYTSHPAYLDGASGISYYECDAETNGSAAGYVLINVDSTDIPIPEFTTSGESLYDEMKSRIPIDTKFRMYRYGFQGVRAFAEPSKGDDARRSTADQMGQNVLAEIGLPDLSQRVAVWHDYVQSEGVVPYYSKSQMSKYLSQSRSIARSLAAAESVVERAAKLYNTYGDGNYTASYTQPYFIGSMLPQPAGHPALDPITYYPVGCGPTAWGIVYAYWKAFKSKSALFPGTDISHDTGYWSDISTVDSELVKIAQAAGTYWGMDSSGTFGATSEFTMGNGANYAQYYGINCSAPILFASLNAWNMFDHVYTALINDRPCIISIYVDASGNGAFSVSHNHVVVVEEALKTKYRTSFLGLFWWPWANGCVTFKINMGWGNRASWDHRYINIIDNDPVYNPNCYLTSAFDMWDVQM